MVCASTLFPSASSPSDRTNPFTAAICAKIFIYPLGLSEAALLLFVSLISSRAAPCAFGSSSIFLASLPLSSGFGLSIFMNKREMKGNPSTRSTASCCGIIVIVTSGRSGFVFLASLKRRSKSIFIECGEKRCPFSDRISKCSLWLVVSNANLICFMLGLRLAGILTASTASEVAMALASNHAPVTSI